MDAFGGRFEQVIVGGAPLNAEVEAFLHRIKFPFTVGYGMTECGPLISYTHHSEFIPRSSGRILEGYMQVKIDSSDPELIPGEICVRGENVMAGYYKNRFSCLWVGTSEGGVGYYERYGFVQDHVVKNFFTDNYPEPIIDNGKPCVDMTYLRLEIR